MIVKARMMGAIAKVEDLDDGTIMVEGIANAPTPDSDGETFTSECMRAAIPDYMAKRRALREMHQPICAGVTKDLWVDDDGVTRIRAHVIDPVSVKKVQAGALKMFSIEGVIPPGGRDAKNRKLVHKLNLREVSLVDVGAHPDAMIETVKLDKSPTEEEADMSGTAEEQNATTTETPDTEGEGTAKMEGDRKITWDVVKKWAGEEIMDARRAIECLDSLFYLFLKEGSEGEASQAADLKVVTDKLRSFISAEILEDNSTPAGQPVALADGAKEGDDNVAKKGAKFSKATKEALKSYRAKMDEAAEILKGLNFDQEDDEDEEGCEEGKAKKVAGPKAEEDAIAKARQLADTVTKLEGEKAELAAKVQEQAEEIRKADESLKSVIEDMKAKGYLKTVGKADDDPSAIRKSEGSTTSTTEGEGADPADPLDAIRKVHRAGGTVINPSAR